MTKLEEPRPTLGFNFDGHDADEFITAVIGTERFTIDIEGIAAHWGVEASSYDAASRCTFIIRRRLRGK